ncbi:uncharacterized protein LOC143018537 [Oratosquilla oratoria]|uniref:uncharacterized protein LOC143018537 n=1 Tax=Oratosquilla oratoria TaxID=337810 RepID=UPI003F76275A
MSTNRQPRSMQSLAASVLTRRLVVLLREKVRTTIDAKRRRRREGSGVHTTTVAVPRHCDACGIAESLDVIELRETYGGGDLGMNMLTPPPVEHLHGDRESTTDVIVRHLNAVRSWWETLPRRSSQVGRELQHALDLHTDVNPKYDSDFPVHLASLLLRLVLLTEVFVDRDFGDKDRLCVVPCKWERWTARLICLLGPYPTEGLRLYGAMYPVVAEAILHRAPFLTSITVSHINITDEFLVTLGSACPRLESLFLLHSFPWQVISLEAFCSAFFLGASKEEIYSALRENRKSDISRSFPKLREMELGYGSLAVAQEFHVLLLAFYPDIRFVCLDWRTNLFEEGYGSHCKNVIFRVLTKCDRLALESLHLDSKTLYDMRNDECYLLANRCPSLRNLTINAPIVGGAATPYRYRGAGTKLLALANKLPLLDSLHINVASEDHLTRATVMPTFEASGEKLVRLVLEASAPGERLYISTVSEIFQLCPNLNQLRLHVWSRSMLVSTSRALVFKNHNLQEFWLHEDGPGDEDEEEDQLVHWIGLLKKVVDGCPNLQTLSVTVCQTLAPLLDTLTCSCPRLHVHVRDGYEWQPGVDVMGRLVQRMPQLQHLHLEEFDASTFWRLRRRYANVQLEVHWGSLSGWPRT